MKLLVIEDQPWNVASAYETLKGHDLTVVDNIKEACDILKKGEWFDTVLTDLWLPAGDFKGHYAGKETDSYAAGLVFALTAAKAGMRVVICTDSDRHADRFSTLLSLLVGEGGSISYVEARSAQMRPPWQWIDGKLIQVSSPAEVKDTETLIKHWGSALAREFCPGA